MIVATQDALPLSACNTGGHKPQCITYLPSTLSCALIELFCGV